MNYVIGLVFNSKLKPEIIPIKTIMVIGHKLRQSDLIFKIGDTVFYREVKDNLNLDSEKSPANLEKN
jgi:hypothetical protein